MYYSASRTTSLTSLVYAKLLNCYYALAWIRIGSAFSLVGERGSSVCYESARSVCAAICTFLWVEREFIILDNTLY